MLTNISYTKYFATIATIAISTLIPLSLSAQTFQGAGALQDIASTSQSLGKYVINIVYVVSGVIGALCLIPALIRFAKQEPQSKDALTSIGIGLIAVFVILAVIKSAMSFN